MSINRLIYWVPPILFHANDANAWGLITHVYYAHSLVWAMPLLDPRLRAAIKSFPELVMTGALLPDLAVVDQQFHETHQWHHAHRLLANATTSEQTALAIGYASHLYVDVIAHNHFVPAHEAAWLQRFKLRKHSFFRAKLQPLLNQHIKLSKWFNHSALTHLMSEWAMDAHLHPLVDLTPSQLLNKHRLEIERFMTQHFEHSRDTVKRSIKRLSFWDGVLRVTRLPQMIYCSAKLFDQKLFQHFTYYIAKTQTAIFSFGQAVNGHTPTLLPELKGLDAEAEQALQKQCKTDLHVLHPIPVEYFSKSIQPSHTSQKLTF